MADLIGSASIEILPDISGFGQEVERSVRGSLDSVGRNLAKVGAGLTASVTAPIVGIGTAAFQTAADFETSMTRITALAGVPTEQLAAMEGQVKSLAAEFGFSGAEAADALFFIVSAGLEGRDALDALEVSLQGAAVGLGSVEDVAKFATTSIAAYGPEVVSAAEATDILGAAASESVLGPEELASSLTSILPLAAEMGVGLDEIAGVVAATSSQFNSGSEAVTAAENALRALLLPSEQAAGILDDVGLSAEELRGVVDEQSLPATLRVLEESLNGDTEAMGKVLGTAEGLRFALATLGIEGDALDTTLGNVSGSAGFMGDAMSAVEETASQQFKVAMAEIKLLLQEIGGPILTAVKDALQTLQPILQNITTAWQNLSPQAQQFIVIGAAIAAALGPALVVLGGLAVAIAAISLPVVIAVAAIGGLIAAGIALAANWQRVSAFLNRTWQSLQRTAGVVWNSVLATIKRTALAAFVAVTGPFGRLVIAVIRNWRQIRTDTIRTWRSIMAFLRGLPDRIIGYFRGLDRRAREIGSDIINGIISGISGDVGRLAAAARNAASRAFEAAKNFLLARSPSRRFMQLGVDTVAGFQIGLDSITPTLPPIAVPAMQDNLLRAAQEVLGQLRATGTIGEDFSFRGMSRFLDRNLTALQQAVGVLDFDFEGLGGPRGGITAATRRNVDRTLRQFIAQRQAAAQQQQRVLVEFDVRGGDREFVQMFKKWIRNNAGGDVQLALGRIG